MRKYHSSSLARYFTVVLITVLASTGLGGDTIRAASPDRAVSPHLFHLPDLNAIRFNSLFRPTPGTSVYQKSAASSDPRAVAIAKRLGKTLPTLKAKALTTASVGRLNPAQSKAFRQLRDRVDTAVEVRLNPLTGTPRQIKGEVLEHAAFGYASKHEKSLATAQNFLRLNKTLLQLDDPAAELTFAQSEQDELGYTHLRYEQTYQGLSVWPTDVIVHVNADDNIDLLDGAFVATPRTLDTLPALDEKAALTEARRAVPGAGQAEAASSELIIYASCDTLPKLAWKFELAVAVTDYWLVVIDAMNGAVLTSYNQVMDAAAVGSGVDVLGVTRPLNVFESDGLFGLVDTSKPMFQPSADPTSLSTAQGVIYILDAQNQPPTSNPQEIPPNLPPVLSTSATSDWLPDGVGAAFHLSEVYDYYRERHNRDSFDGQGGNLVGIIRFGQGLLNAFWSFDLRVMTFGDGDFYTSALDVVGHEVTHGVIQESANLVYQDQPGALNESFSDIFGQLIEARNEGGFADWILGDALQNPVRSMSNPASLEVAPGSGRVYPQRMSDFFGPNDPFLAQIPGQDNGGVHINSSITNYAFYLLAEGLPGALSLQDAGQIFYRALTVHMTKNSQFIDARLACVQSAEELFGQGSIQAQRTAEAFDAVEIFDAAPSPAPEEIPSVDGVDATLFVQRDAATGNFLLGRREAGLGDGAPGVQLASTVVAAARPSVSRNGVFAVYVNSQNDGCLVTTNGLEEVCLEFPGQIASVSMSPDSRLFGFVFLDAMGNRDNQISVIDLQTDTARTFTLTAPVLDGPTLDNIQFAATLDFTLDGQFLVYDALNSLSFSDGSRLDAWSIYALNLETETILSLVPPTPGADISAPSLSQTSDNFLTFDIFDQVNNQSVVAAMNLDTSQAVAVATVPNGLGVPGYSGDDSAIIYSQTDPSTPTGFNLVQQPMAADRITPQGQTSVWLMDADFGVIYRRATLLGALENPLDGSFQSGAGLFSGWVCDALRVDLEIDGTALFEAAYGTSRGDTIGVCGDTNNGFALLTNWNLVGEGTHTVRALADGVEFASGTFTVATLGTEFLSGASGAYSLSDFPQPGQNVVVTWQQAAQNFVITDYTKSVANTAVIEAREASVQPLNGPTGALENPSNGSFQSGGGLFAGWVCDAQTVEIEIDGAATFEAAYGTARGDTIGICGDANNGFALLTNWNLIGDGTHTVRALADGQQFGTATFTITTLGTEFLSGASGSYSLPNFPQVGTNVLIEWQQESQNFVIRGVE